MQSRYCYASLRMIIIPIKINENGVSLSWGGGYITSPPQIPRNLSSEKFGQAKTLTASIGDGPADITTSKPPPQPPTRLILDIDFGGGVRIDSEKIDFASIKSRIGDPYENVSTQNTCDAHI